MFSPPAPMMRQYCERDESGTGPVLDEDEGEEVLMLGKTVIFKLGGTLQAESTDAAVGPLWTP